MTFGAFLGKQRPNLIFEEGLLLRGVILRGTLLSL